MKKYLTRALVLTAGVVSVAGLTACSSTGDVSNLAVRKFTWFSFLSGDDLKPQCATGGDHLRFVHNAIYQEDMRVLEVDFAMDGAAQVKEQVYLAPDLLSIPTSLSDFKAPWAPEEFAVDWTKAQADAVLSAVQADQGFVPLQKDVPIDSNAFFWTMAGCHNGAWVFKAWAYPDAAYTALTFPKALAAHMPSEKPFSVARSTENDFPVDDDDIPSYFKTSANANGVRGGFR